MRAGVAGHGAPRLALRGGAGAGHDGDERPTLAYDRPAVSNGPEQPTGGSHTPPGDAPPSDGGHASGEAAFESTLHGWDCLRLRQGRTELALVPDVGGRVLSLVYDGEELFFSHPELRGRRLDVLADPDPGARKRGLGWLHWGGYKNWLAPQEAWSDALPFLDLDSGRYECTATDGAIEARSPVCRESGMRFLRRVRLLDESTVSVEQLLVNESDRPASWGLWDVTQMQGSGLAVLPIAPDSGFAGGVKAYPNEGRSPEILERMVARRDGAAWVRCRQAEPFKFGTDSTEGWIAALLDRGPDRWLGYAKSFAADTGGEYAHGSVVEVYDSGDLPYYEIECHSVRQRLAPGESLRLDEIWRLAWLDRSIDATDLRRWLAPEAAP